MAELISTKTVRYNDNMPDFSLIAVGGDKKGLAYLIPKKILPDVADWLRLELEMQLCLFVPEQKLPTGYWEKRGSIYSKLLKNNFFDDKYDARTEWRLVFTSDLLDNKHEEYELRGPIPGKKYKTVTQKQLAYRLSECWGVEIAAKDCKMREDWAFYYNRQNDCVECIYSPFTDIYAEEFTSIPVDKSPFSATKEVVLQTIQQLNHSLWRVIGYQPDEINA
jgi:hypothetical protein